MGTKSDRGDGRPKRGGSDTARLAGQVGIVVHVSREQHRWLGMAARHRDQSLKEFVREAALAAVPPDIRKIPPAKT